MTLPIPLTVRVGSRHIEHELHDLSFRSVTPGGFASARMTLNRRLDRSYSDFDYYSPVSIGDARNGNVVFDGRLDDPGRSVGTSGELLELSAVGGSAHAHDRTLPHIFVDSGTEDWENATNSVKYMEWSEILSNDDPAIKMIFPEGTTMTQTDYGEVWYRRLVDTSQRVARVDFDWDAGTTTTNNEINMDLSVGTGGGNDNVDAAALNTAGGTLTAIITTDWSAGTDHDVVRCLFLRNGPTVVAGNNAVIWFIPNIRTVLFNKSGSELTAASNYTTLTVRAEAVVEDLLGRILTEYDGPNATIQTSTYGIDHLAYREAVDAWKVFEDLLVFHPDNTWHAWERSPVGLYAFEWIQKPSTVRFEADVVDGFNAPGSAVDLFNYVSVRWVGAQGRVRHTRRTATVPMLDDAGLIREGYVDLKFDAGTSANAIRAGDEFLAQHAIPLSGASLTIARPILDRDKGIMRQPWELVRHAPGNLIRVRGVVPAQDALNATARDGVSVFRIVGADYSASSASVTLELDSEPVSLSQMLARKKGPKTA